MARSNGLQVTIVGADLGLGEIATLQLFNHELT